MTTDKATYRITKSHYNIYESGDKAGKLLAQQARQSASSRLIPKVHGQNGEIVTNHSGINNVFKQFHSDLYSSCDDPASSACWESYLSLSVSLY